MKAETRRAEGLRKNDYFLRMITRKYILNSTMAMISLFAGALIDTVIVGIFLNEDGLSAMSLVGPVYLIYYTIGSVFGIGGSLAAGKCIGKGDYAKYRQIFTASFAAEMLLGILTTVLGLLFLSPIARVLSGGNHMELVREYLRFYFVGGGFTLLSYIPLYFLKTDGRPQKSSVLYLIQAALNCVLTYLFVSPIFDLGIGGAALATSVSAVIAVIGGMIILLHGGEIHFEKGFIHAADWKEIIKDGIPSGLSNLLESLRIIIVNVLLLGISASLLPAFTVVRNVMDLINALMIGVALSLMPLGSVFFAEHDFASIRIVFKRVLRVGMAVSFVSFVIAAAFPTVIGMLFGIHDENTLKELKTALPLACAGTLAAYANIHITYYFNTIGQTLLANLVLSLRMFVFLVGTAVPLSKRMGGTGVWLAFSASELLTLLLCIGLILVLKKRKRVDGYLLPAGTGDALEIDFSVKNNLDDIMEASNRIAAFCQECRIDAKRTMRLSLAIEEILQVLIVKCVPADRECFIDIRICRFDDHILMRIRNIGVIFNPISYYNDNIGNEDMAEELLGLKMIINSSKKVDFHQTFGTNNLTILF